MNPILDTTQLTIFMPILDALLRPKRGHGRVLSNLPAQPRDGMPPPAMP